MYLRYSLGFLIASLVQAAIVLSTEALNITSLGAKLTLMQLITHILAGQIAGYLLLFVMRKVEFIHEIGAWVTGAVYGLIVWAVVLYINSAQGKVNAPWNQDFATMFWSILAFAVYGIIAALTIKGTDRKFVRG